MTIEARFRIEREDFSLDIDLCVPARGITTLLGPSGCGKTTVLRAIAGLEQHAGAFLKVGDMIWQQAGYFLAPHQRPLGYVFQEASLFAHLNVRRNLEFGLRRVAHQEQRISLNQAIELVEIGHLLERRPQTLSGGERQRVAIARALAVSPRLLLMDEPLAALDIKRRLEILPYIRSLPHELGIPVIYVSHAADEVARLADHPVLLEAGQIVATGSIDEIFTRLDLPLAHQHDAAAIIDAVVAGYDGDYHLTHLDFPGGRVSVTGREAMRAGQRIRLQLAARDVSLTLARQSDTSILNIFPAVIDELSEEGSAQVTVRLLVAGVPLLSRITRKSAVELGLVPGKQVYAQAKSVAVLT